MPGHYFISYSDADGRDFALRLHDALESTTNCKCWLDKLDLPGGGKWFGDLSNAIGDSQLVLFVMTRDSIRDNNTCQQELLTALKYKKPIVPLRLHPVGLPFLINTRQWIDFTGDFGIGMAKLREHLRWRETLEATLQDLRDRLQDAERDLDRKTESTDRARIKADIAQLKQDIEKQKHDIANPQAAAARTEASIAAGLERERAPAKPVSGTARTKFINAPPTTAPSYFQDRYEENKLVKKFLENDAQRMLTIVGRAGIGKTAMACRLLKSLENVGAHSRAPLPDDLGEIEISGIVYLSAVGTRVVNVPNLFADLCQLLPTETTRELDALYKNPQASTEAKMHALLSAFPTGRVLVLLDNFETALDVATTKVRDAELDEALRALLNAPHHTVKVIATTRVAPHDLLLFQPARHARLNLDEGLESPFAENILREMDVDGKLGLKNAPADLLDRAREYTRGFPRALEALYAILSADRYTTLVETLHATSLPDNVVQALVGEAFNRLDPTAERVMIALAAFNRPVPPAALDYLLQPFLPSVDSAPVLNRLVNMRFAYKDNGRYHLHPADRDYAFQRLEPGSISSGKDGFTEFIDMLSNLVDKDPKAGKCVDDFMNRNSEILYKMRDANPQDMQHIAKQHLDFAKNMVLFPFKNPRLIKIIFQASISFFLKSKGKQSNAGQWIQFALLRRSADYFEKLQRPVKTWKSLDDLAPQITEFDLRCSAQDYNAAADIFVKICPSLDIWGRYRTIVELYEKIRLIPKLLATN